MVDPMIPKLDTFLFIYLFNQKDENLAKRNDLLNVIRTYINSIGLFAKSEISIKPRSITVNDDNFYVSFNTREKFSMGFACDKEYIQNLNSILNELILLLERKEQLSGIENIRIQSNAKYSLPEIKEFLSKIICNDKIELICPQFGKLKARNIELECAEKNESVGDLKVTFELDEKDNKNKILEIDLSKIIPKMSQDESMTTLNMFDELANKIMSNLFGDN